MHRQLDTSTDGYTLPISVDGQFWASVVSSYGMGTEITVSRTPPNMIVHFDGDKTQTTEAIAFSPDGAELARIDGGRLVTCEARTGRTLMDTILHTENLYSVNVSYSDDGTKLGVAGQFSQTQPNESYFRWSIHDRRTGEMLQSEKCSQGCFSAALSPAGRQVALSGSNRPNEAWIRVRNLEQDVPAVTATFSTSQPIKYGTRTVWSDDSRHVLVTASSTIAMFDGATGMLIWQVDTSAGPDSDFVYGLTFRGDNRRILAGLDKSRIWILDATNGIPVCRLEKMGSFETTWTPDGKLLITSGMDRDSHVWDLKLDE